MSLSSIRRRNDASLAPLASSTSGDKFGDLYASQAAERKNCRRTFIFDDKFIPFRRQISASCSTLAGTPSATSLNSDVGKLQKYTKTIMRQGRSEHTVAEEENNTVATADRENISFVQNAHNSEYDNSREESDNGIDSNNGNDEELLSRQLRHAKEMGFTDAEIFAALEMNANSGASNENYKPFASISIMVDALSTAQKQLESRKHFTKHHRTLPTLKRNPLSVSVSCLASNPTTIDNESTLRPTSGIALTTDLPRASDKWKLSLPHDDGLPNASSASVFRFASFNDAQIAAQRRAEIGAPNLKRNLTLAGDAIGISGANYSQKSSIQRLIDAFEIENRRNFDAYQRVNCDLKNKLESDALEIERLRANLRRKSDEAERQRLELKRHADLQRRIEHANRRIEDMTKELKLRDADALRQFSELSTLRRQIDVERRKADECKNAFSAEISRLSRENSHAEQIFRENATLKSEIMVKEELLRKIMSQSACNSMTNSYSQSYQDHGVSNGSSNSHHQEQYSTQNDTSDNALDAWREEPLEERSSHDEISDGELRQRIARLEAENRELAERQSQGPTCGVCMDNRREVIFMPCLHFTCCKNCADAMDHCSICRLRIMGKIEFFQ